MAYTLPLNKREFEPAVQSLIYKIKKNLLKVVASNLDISFGKNLSKLYLLDAIRLVYEIKTDSPEEAIFKNIILEMMLSAQKTFPLAEIYALLAVISNFYYHDIDSLLNRLYSCAHLAYKANEQDLEQILDSVKTCEISKIISNTILQTGGPTCRIDIQDGKEFDTKIKFVNGHKFNAYVDHRFQLAVKKNIFKFKLAKVLVIDGVIDAVSEAHHLFEHFNKSKETLVIICRGFEEEVVSTLAINYKRKTLNVIPVVVPSSLETINSLKDISVVSGVDLVSSLKGDLISSIDPAEIKKINSIILEKSELTMFESSTSRAIDAHVNSLQEKIKEEHGQDKLRLLEKRIASLTPNIVHVSLGLHLGEFQGLTKDRVYSLIGVANSVCLTGIITIKDEFNFISDFIPNNKITAAGPFLEGVKLGLSTIKIIRNINSTIIIDR
tara:strand:+ start:8614 stop:9930 length:1317 start_codon:yes stop_codon:yes gene_type:complete